MLFYYSQNIPKSFKLHVCGEALRCLNPAAGWPIPACKLIIRDTTVRVAQPQSRYQQQSTAGCVLFGLGHSVRELKAPGLWSQVLQQSQSRNAQHDWIPYINTVTLPSQETGLQRSELTNKAGTLCLLTVSNSTMPDHSKSVPFNSILYIFHLVEQSLECMVWNQPTARFLLHFAFR